MKLNLSALLPASLVGVLLAGCQPTRPETATEPRASSSQEVLPLEKFPKAEELLLASIQPRLEPNRVLSLRAPQTGRLQLTSRELVTAVEQDTIWAVLEPKALQAEAEALTLWREQLETRQELETELELPLQRLQVEKQLDEAKRTLQVWLMYQEDSDRGRRAMELLGIDLGSGDPEEARRLRWEIELLETRLQYLRSERPVSDLELQSRRVEWEQRQLEFQKREAQARMAAPFAGELRLLIRPPEDEGEVWVQGNEDIALLRDLSVAVLRLRPDDASWAGAPFQDLILRVRIPGMGELEARPAREEVDSTSTRQERVWIFELDLGELSADDLPLGAPVSARLVQILPSEGHILPKTALLTNDISGGDSWEDLFQAAYPGSRLLAVGQTEIAAEPAP